MAGALTWTLGLKDGMSGPGAAMGGVLGALTSKLRAAGEESDRLRKRQEDLFKANVGRDAIAKIAKKQAGQESGAKSDFLANMKHNDAIAARDNSAAKAIGDDFAANMARHDAAAFEETKKKADAAKRAIDAYAKAAAASQGGTLFSARSTMGKTDANGAGLFGAAKVSGFASLIQKLSQLNPKLGQAAMGLAGFAAKADDALASVGGLGGALSAVGGGLMAVGSFALKAGAVIVGAVAAGSIALGKFVAEMQAFKQSTMFAFGALLGGADKATAAWDKVKAVSLSTGTSLTEVGGAFNSLLAQGFNLDEVDTLVKRMADLKTLNPAANIDGIARAISQIKSTGKLQGDELMQLNEAGLSSKLVYEELAKSLGKTVPEIQKMQKAGQITDKMAIDAIQKAIAKQTGGKAPGALAIEAANKTLTGSVGKMYAAVQVWASGLNIDFSSLGRFADRLGRVFAGDAGKKLGESIEGAFNRVLGLLDRMSEKDMATTLYAAAAAIDAIAASAEKVNGLIQWGGGLGESASMLNTILGLTSMLAFAWDLVMNPAEAFVNLLGAAYENVAKIVGALTGIKLPSLDELIGKAVDTASNPTAVKAAQNTQQGQPGDAVTDAIRKVTGPQPGQPAQPGQTAVNAPTQAVDPKTQPRGPSTVTVTANGLTFEGFEAKVAEIVRAELEKG